MTGLLFLAWFGAVHLLCLVLTTPRGRNSLSPPRLDNVAQTQFPLASPFGGGGAAQAATERALMQAPPEGVY